MPRNWTSELDFCIAQELDFLLLQQNISCEISAIKSIPIQELILKALKLIHTRTILLKINMLHYMLFHF